MCMCNYDIHNHVRKHMCVDFAICACSLWKHAGATTLYIGAIALHMRIRITGTWAHFIMCTYTGYACLYIHTQFSFTKRGTPVHSCIYLVYTCTYLLYRHQVYRKAQICYKNRCYCFNIIHLNMYTEICISIYIYTHPCIYAQALALVTIKAKDC